MKQPLILVLVGLFVAVLILRMIKAYFLAHHLKSKGSGLPEGADDRLSHLMSDATSPPKARAAIQNIVREAQSARTPAIRSAYFVAAGHLALNPLKRPPLAVGFYLRAIRSDPTCQDALRKLQEILIAQKRYRRLEWTYWEILARLDDSEVGEDVWLVCWAGLAAIYAASPRDIHKADAIRKALTAFVSEDDEKEIERRSNIPKAIS